MIAQLFKCRVLPEGKHLQVVQAAVLSIAVVFLVGGVLRIAALELNEAQLYLGFGILFGLVLQCGILWVLIEMARKLGRGRA